MSESAPSAAGKELRVTRRAFSEALLSAGSVAILLLALMTIDDGLREQLSERFAIGNPVEFAGDNLRNLTAVVVQAVRHQSLAHAPLVVFALAAALLVVLMLRT